MISEPGPQNVRTKVLTGGTAKINVAEFISGRPIPSAMIPRTRNQIIQMVRVGFLEDFISFDRPVEIFLVPPTGDVHDWHLGLLELITEGLLLPKQVIIRMIDEVIPGGQFAVEILRIHIR